MIFLATFQSFSCTFTVKYWRANDWRHYFCSFSWIGLGRRQSLLLLGRRDMTKLSILWPPPQPPKKIKNGFLDSLPLSHNCPFFDRSRVASDTIHSKKKGHWSKKTLACCYYVVAARRKRRKKSISNRSEHRGHSPNFLYSPVFVPGDFF